MSKPMFAIKILVLMVFNQHTMEMLSNRNVINTKKQKSADAYAINC